MPAILIIDDDAVVRSSLTFLLKRAGYQPSAVKGPKEAILAIRESRPDLVLMDMNFSLTTTGEEGILLAHASGDTHDGLGLDRLGCSGYAGRRFRFHHQAMEQPGAPEYDQERFGSFGSQ